MSPNLLAGSRVYLCGNMEFGNGEGWRNRAKAELQAMGVKVFDPYHKPFVNEIHENDEIRKGMKTAMLEGRYEYVAQWVKEVRRDDLRQVDISDFLIVNIVPHIPSWGTPEELYWGNRMKKPIFVSIEGGKGLCPIWLMGTLPHEYIYSNIDEVMNVIKRIDSGEQPMDNGRWRLLKKEYR